MAKGGTRVEEGAPGCRAVLALVRGCLHELEQGLRTARQWRLGDVQAVGEERVRERPHRSVREFQVEQAPQPPAQPGEAPMTEGEDAADLGQHETGDHEPGYGRLLRPEQVSAGLEAPSSVRGGEAACQLRRRGDRDERFEAGRVLLSVRELHDLRRQVYGSTARHDGAAALLHVVGVELGETRDLDMPTDECVGQALQ